MSLPVLEDPKLQRDIPEIAKTLYRSKRCVLVTGAGISVTAGIPVLYSIHLLKDFRSADGMYKIVKEKYPNVVLKGIDMFDASLFRDPKATQVFYALMAEMKQLSNQASATPTHKFIYKLHQNKKLLRCYTQNIDSLETRFDLLCDIRQKDAKVIQLHGDLDHVYCTLCRTVLDLSTEYLQEFRNGQAPPCPKCLDMEQTRKAAGRRATAVGLLRPNVNLYNEYHESGIYFHLTV